MKSGATRLLLVTAVLAAGFYTTASYVTSAIDKKISQNTSELEAALGKKIQDKVDCTEIKNLPTDIQVPGKYCLTSNLDNPNEKRDSITIFVDGVTINGNNYCIEGSHTPTALHSGVRAIDRMNVTIKNLCIKGHKTGILIGDSADAYASDFENYGINSFRSSAFINISDSSLSRQTFQAIHVRGSNISVTGNSIEHVGGVMGENPFATGIYLSAVNCEVSENRVFDLRPSGNGEGVGIALYEGSGCKITKNLIDPFRKTEHGRTFGIWSKSRKNDVALIADNTVIDADYAYGPFGYYKDNSAVDSACDLFVDRTFSLSHNEVGGWLSTDNNKHIKTPKIRKCHDDLDDAITRAKSNLNKYSAYSVVLAYGEQDPTKNEAAQVAWIMIAADLKHETAVSIMSSSPTAGRRQEVFDKAKAIYKKMKSEIKIASSN
ncbi:hypothetical protein LOY64_14645 [Pseudomonas corrugata]|uniref:hypothetical protein n=1 Tax=Pseudomonas corrugata TaxID=47879 RepID=UPI00222F6259|nr:hypothetical protein [Pseudomonas corrugata]UZD98172.1 hypothetical protein LOY64_14645 [Pseudomonas corrugata]